MAGLVLAGPYRGQGVYYDEDFCGQPFFVWELFLKNINGMARDP